MYVRSPYYEYESGGKWRYDPIGRTSARINRQQYRHSVALSRRAAIHSRALSSPFKVSGGVDKTVKSLTRDKQLSTSDMKQRSVRLPQHGSQRASRCTRCLPPTRLDRQSVLLLDTAKAAPTLARLRTTTPQPSSDAKAAARHPAVVGERAGAERIRADRLGEDDVAVAHGGRVQAGEGPHTDADRSDCRGTEVRYVGERAARHGS